MERSYNEILKKTYNLLEGINYDEINLSNLFAIVITKENKVVFSCFYTLDLIESIDLAREELSKQIVFNMMKYGVLSLYNKDKDSLKTFEEYKEMLIKYNLYR